MSDWNNFLPTRDQVVSATQDPDFWKKRGYVKVADEGERYTVKANTGVDVVYGVHHEGKNKYVQKKFGGKLDKRDVQIMCINPSFDKDPAPKVKKACYAKIVKDIRKNSNGETDESSDSVNVESTVEAVDKQSSDKGKYIVIGASVLALALITTVVIKIRKKI